jgi:hypothetical protein
MGMRTASVPERPESPMIRVIREGSMEHLRTRDYFLPSGQRVTIPAGATGIRDGLKGREYHRHDLRKVRWWHRPCVVCEDGRVCICWTCLWKLAVASAVGAGAVEAVHVVAGWL